MTKVMLQLLFYFVADPCYHYKNLSAADRNIIKITPKNGPVLCDSPFSEGWYRFVGAAGTKMPTTRVPAYRCSTDWSGWLLDAHPTVEDGEVKRKVCFSDRSSGCRYSNEISVKNCESYFIYKLYPLACSSRYCGTDGMWSKKFQDIRRLIHWSSGSLTSGIFRNPLFMIIFNFFYRFYTLMVSI